MHPLQHTLAQPVECSGTGIQSGQPVTVRILPAEAGTGIVFRRTDLAGYTDIPALPPFIKNDERRCTILHDAKGAEAVTIEHLMAALYGHNIDNAIIELSAPELPILDGSAKEWGQMLQQAGRTEQDAPQRVLRLLKPIRVTSADGNRWIEIAPQDEGRKGLSLDVGVAFDHPAINDQDRAYWAEDRHDFEHIGCAKTFGFIDHVEEDYGNGMSHGGSMQNAVLIGRDRIVNPDIMTYDDEFARHKAVDLMGDLALLGMRIDAKITAQAPGHALNHELLSAILRERGAFEILPSEKQFTHRTTDLPSFERTA